MTACARTDTRPEETPTAESPAPRPSDGDAEGAEDASRTPTPCPLVVANTPVPLASASSDGETILTVEAQTHGVTSWAEKGNEAVILEVLRDDERIGDLVLHQGNDRFTYAMHTGSLRAGDRLTVRVSDASAPGAARSACIGSATLAPASPDMAEGLAHAPVLKWPREKAFDDLPLVIGWSRHARSYQLVFTNENGGTVSICGGGARGMRSEIARWGRGLDIEGVWSYGGARTFKRCKELGRPSSPRMDDAHPILYYGDGHNSLFESRGGYGAECGTKADEMADGSLVGWNVQNPGNEVEKDGPFTVVLRPVPVDLDALGFEENEGRREGIVDTYAPWLYRLVDAELAREGKIDGKATFSMSRYLYADVHALDVGGSGDETCGGSQSGGFRLRVVAKNGAMSLGPQMTNDFFGSNGSGVKRIAVPLAEGVGPDDIDGFVFDAYDNDGIYFLGLGDAFVPRAIGTNGAVLDYVVRGTSANVYVDDDSSSCVDGTNTKDGAAYPCVGTAFTFSR